MRERLLAFQRALERALQTYAPLAKVTIEVKRDITLISRVIVDDETFIAVYYNALSEKTSFALIHNGQRVVGYDNYRFCHYHPPNAPNTHRPCDKPTVSDAIETLIEVHTSISLSD
jgi:hypothetical protein